MKIFQKRYTVAEGWINLSKQELTGAPQLVLVFGSKSLLFNSPLTKQIISEYNNSQVVFVSSSGEIAESSVTDETLTVTAIRFDSTHIKTTHVRINDFATSYDAGIALINSLQKQELKNVLVFSDGQLVNGSELISGINIYKPAGVVVSGGMAGDGVDFSSTLVGLNSEPSEGNIIAIGFYGALQVTSASIGGWDTFGRERKITRSDGNVLYELDGQPALDIYIKYLNCDIEELVAKSLLFPLGIQYSEEDHSVVRTILNIDRENKSMTFAGNIPQGCMARLMKCNINRLIEGSGRAASECMNAFTPDLAILISCVGRKMILDQRVEEEIEIVRDIFGNDTALTGFYSYGEISPKKQSLKTELHNQTMTITAFKE